MDRRGLLAAGALACLAGAAGCGLLDRAPDPPPAPDPLEPLRTQARALVAGYDTAIAAAPALAGRLTPIRDAHRAHANELDKLLGPPRTGGTTPSGDRSPGVGGSPGPGSQSSGKPGSPAAVLADLRAAEDRARQDALAAGLATTPARAGLVGAIAAARASHLEVLR